MSATAQDLRLAMHRRRKRVNVIALTASLAAMAFGVFWLLWILFETVRLGWGGMAMTVFTQMTPPPQADTGGLANAIFGSLVMVSLATRWARPSASWPGCTWPNTARRPGWATRCASSTTSCCRHRPSSSASSSTPWWWRRSGASRAGPACWRWR
jgi:hypothetical protein